MRRRQAAGPAVLVHRAATHRHARVSHRVRRAVGNVAQADAHGGGRLAPRVPVADLEKARDALF